MIDTSGIIILSLAPDNKSTYVCKFLESSQETKFSLVSQDSKSIHDDANITYVYTSLVNGVNSGYMCLLLRICRHSLAKTR